MRGYRKQLKEELRYLKDNTKGKFFLKNFRKASYLNKNGLHIYAKIFRLYYNFLFNYLLCIDIPSETTIGFGFNVFHGQGLVISKETVIGNYVTVRQSTTIGNSKPGSRSPIIGNNVDIGANVVIIGEISIGDNVIIAAGSVVIHDVPPNVMIAGNPAIIKKKL